MKVAIRHIHNNLVWATSGTVWAVWRIEPIGSRYASALERQEVLSRVTALIRSLSGTARLYSLCARVEPWEIAARMTAGVDLDAHPEAEEIAKVSKAMLTGEEMHRRTLWLAVPLQAPGRAAQWAQARGAMWTVFEEQAGLPAAPVPENEVTLYRGVARQLEAGFGGGLQIRPARPAEIVWMHQHAVHRGQAEPLLADAEVSRQRGGKLVGAQLRSPSYASLGQVRVLEGGDTAAQAEDREQGEGLWAGVRRWLASRFDGSALSRLWLEVETEDGTGYQSHMALEEIPEAVIESSADILAQLERLEYPVDATIDLTIVDSAKARRQIAKKKKELVDQADQWAAHPTGAPDTIYGAAETLGEQEARLGRTSVEREVQSRTVLTVWGPTAQECDERARNFKARLTGADYGVIRPRGGQERLFALGLPGAAPAWRARECTQYQLSEDFALSGPLTSGEIGDDTGSMIAQSLDVGTTRPVLLDLAGAPLRDAAASLAVIGDLGSGKSVLLKRLTADVVDRGHRAIVIDRTPQREWSDFARCAAPGRSQVIDAARAEVSIDPLRVLPPAQGEAAALSYLNLQLCLEPMSLQGAAVSRAVKAAAAAPRPHMGLVLAELEAISQESGPRGDAAAEVLDLLHTVSDRPLAAMLFDPVLPALDLDNLAGDLVVFTTAGLTLPPREALARPEVLRTQPLEALIGRAVLYVIAAISRHVAFSDRTRFCPVVMDECYWLTSSTEGHALVKELAHDGRKHWAGMYLGGHDALDLGDETIQGLITYRLLARTGDEAMARRGLAFLNLPADDESLVQLVTGLSPTGNKRRVGEMLLHDGSGRIGQIQVIVPRIARYAGIFTTPGKDTSPAGRGKVLETAGAR
ncbi:ATP/GTP-binding protein [Streptomyces kaniharaensis]|uniref:ATP/GTP-binding protein n=1 Tax=Streptomyces kaniharaensis TaxID=212423 RepID=A0A6N7L4H1_9ACTN|nr:ATP-binding protein [Streptomyces kaniharaensis]MQS17528.1 ATP/GTP-binding protein [Streptomyces kaniharaensis]